MTKKKISLLLLIIIVIVMIAALGNILMTNLIKRTHKSIYDYEVPLYPRWNIMYERGGLLVLNHSGHELPLIMLTVRCSVGADYEQESKNNYSMLLEESKTDTQLRVEPIWKASFNGKDVTGFSYYLNPTISEDFSITRWLSKNNINKALTVKKYFLNENDVLFIITLVMEDGNTKYTKEIEKLISEMQISNVSCLNPLIPKTVKH